MTVRKKLNELKYFPEEVQSEAKPTKTIPSSYSDADDDFYSSDDYDPMGIKSEEAIKDALNLLANKALSAATVNTHLKKAQQALTFLRDYFEVDVK